MLQKGLEYWNVIQHFIQVYAALYVLSTALARDTVSRTVTGGAAAFINKAVRRELLLALGNFNVIGTMGSRDISNRLLY